MECEKACLNKSEISQEDSKSKNGTVEGEPADLSDSEITDTEIDGSTPMATTTIEPLTQQATFAVQKNVAKKLLTGMCHCCWPNT